MASCASSAQLARLLNLTASPSEQADFEVHLRECADCRQEVLRRLGDSEWEEWRRGTNGAGTPGEPATAMLHRGNRTWPNQQASDGDDESVQVLRFLKDYLRRKASAPHPLLPATLAPGGARDQEETPIGAPWPEIPGYQILGQLGRGGMGVVYKARQRGLNRLVALKMIVSGAHASAEDLTRFRTEAEAVAQLKHQNIVDIYETGQHDGLPWFALEFVEGGALSDRLDGTPLPAHLAAELIEILAQAMHHAHEKGIVHRDLKPANVLLQATDLVAPSKQGLADRSSRSSFHMPRSNFWCTPKITDFGLAKKLDSQAHLTESGSILGTPSYMAPEQAEGRSKDVGAATDVYALGVILYELLTGRPPFKADTPINTIMMVVSEEPIPPSQLVPKCPIDVESICLKCLQKEPRKRYPTARELADDLARFLEGSPTHARPASNWERFWRWARKRPAVAALSATLVFILVFGFTLVSWQWQLSYSLAISETNAKQAEQHARRAEEVARLQAEAAEQVARDRAEKEEQARKREERAKALAEDRRREAVLAESRLALQRGLALCRQSDIAPGLLWLVRSLKRAEEAGADQAYQDGIRVHLAAWKPRLTYLRHVLEHTDGPRQFVGAAVYGNDGTMVLTGAGADRTSGEARLWDVASGQALGPAFPHRLGISALALSPDGKQALSGSWDGTAWLWDPRTGKHLAPAFRHEDAITAVDFSRDGKLVIVASKDGAARMWETATGRPRGEVLRHPKGVWQAQFGPDGDLAMTAGQDGMLRLWETATGRAKGTPIQSGGPIHAARFSPNGKQIVIGSSAIVEGRARGVARIWDVATGKPRGVPLVHDSLVETARFSPDGRTIVTTCQGGPAQLWDAATGNPRRQLRAAESVRAAVFSPDSKQVLTATGRTAQLWDAGTGQPVSAPLQHAGAGVNAIAFSPDGRTFLTGSLAHWGSHWGTAWLWEAPTVSHSSPALAHAAAVTALAVRADGRVWATGCRNGAGFLRSADATLLHELAALGGKEVDAAHITADRGWVGRQTGPLAVEEICAARFTADGRTLVTVNVAGTVQRWDVAEGRRLTSAKLPIALGADLVISPDGQTVLSSQGRAAQVWHAATGAPAGKPMQLPSQVWGLAFGPQPNTVIIGDQDGKVSLWNQETGQSIATLGNELGWVRSLVVSPDGRFLITCSLHQSARLWHLRSGGPRGPLGYALPQAEGVGDAVFSPDSRLFLTYRLDGLAQMWEVATRQPVGPPLPWTISAAVFRTDGKAILVGTENGMVHVCDVPAALSGESSRLAAQIELLTRQELDANGVVRPLAGVGRKPETRN